MAFCSSCGTQIPDGATTCAACAGRAAAAPAPAAAAPGTGGMADNVAGMLAYFTFIPSIIFLVMEPYNRNRFVRFHSWQNLFFCGALLALWIAYMIIAIVFAFIPILGHVINLLLWVALFFGEIAVWIILVIKANGGQMYKLPVIGDLAEKQANAI
ncbi:MAG: zinc-ribbon domain-containing protein [Terriglobales bacterium]